MNQNRDLIFHAVYLLEMIHYIRIYLFWKLAKAIGRKCEHGSEWKPDKYHRICGLHFYSGNYSNDPQDPDYVPSWFQNKGTIQGVEQLNIELPEKNIFIFRR